LSLQFNSISANLKQWQGAGFPVTNVWEF